MFGATKRITGVTERKLAQSMSGAPGVVLGFRGWPAGQRSRVLDRAWSRFCIVIDGERVGDSWSPRQAPHFEALGPGQHHLDLVEQDPDDAGDVLMSAGFDVNDGPTVLAIWPAEEGLWGKRPARIVEYSLSSDVKPRW